MFKFDSFISSSNQTRDISIIVQIYIEKGCYAPPLFAVHGST